MKKRKCLLLGLLLMGCYSLKAQNHFTERDTIDVLHYDICLDMGHHQARHMQGWCEVTVRMLKPSSEVGLGLMYATVDSVQVEGHTLGSRDYSYDQRQLQIPVGNANSGDTLRLKVYYGSQGWVGGDGGMWCLDNLFYNLGEDRQVRPFSMGRSWFPCSDSVYDRATYTFHLTVPQGWTAISSGEHDSTVHNADSSLTYHYTLRYPISTYHVGVNAARYNVYTREAVGLYGNYPARMASISLDQEAMERGFAGLDRTLQLYERLFGPYRWGGIGFSEGGINSGMEHVNNICMGFSNTVYYLQYLIDHEFAHQWFGNLITCAYLSDMWFNEGGATFADQMASMGSDPTMLELAYHKANVLTYQPLSENGYHPLCGMPNQYSFQGTTYYKGAMVFHELNQLLGDSVFYGMLQKLFECNAYTNMDSYQLRDSMSVYSGVDLTDFYNFHIFNGGFASYSVDSLRTADGLTDIWISQRLWHAPDYCRQANVPVTFFSMQGDTATCHVASTGVHAHGQYRLPFTPSFAIVDYYHRSACANISERMQLTNKAVSPSIITNFIISPTDISDTVNLYVSLQLGEADETEVPGVVRWYNRRWCVNGSYNNDFKANYGFMFGNNQPVLDRDFYYGEATKDSLRLFYRKDASSPWKMRKSAKVETYSNSYSYYQYMKQFGTPLKGEYTLAVVDTALLDIHDNGEIAPRGTSPRLSVAPNPAKEEVTISFATADENPGQCQLTVRNATGRQVRALSPTGYSIRTNVADLPAGIYYVTLTTPTGSCTKKLAVQ